MGQEDWLPNAIRPCLGLEGKDGWLLFPTYAGGHRGQLKEIT